MYMQTTTFKRCQLCTSIWQVLVQFTTPLPAKQKASSAVQQNFFSSLLSVEMEWSCWLLLSVLTSALLLEPWQQLPKIFLLNAIHAQLVPAYICILATSTKYMYFQAYSQTRAYSRQKGTCRKQNVIRVCFSSYNKQKCFTTEFG